MIFKFKKRSCHSFPGRWLRFLCAGLIVATFAEAPAAAEVKPDTDPAAKVQERATLPGRPGRPGSRPGSSSPIEGFWSEPKGSRMMSIMFMGGTVVLRMGHETHKGSFSIKDQRIILNFDDGSNWQFDYQLENENNLLVLDGKYRLSRYHTPEPSVTTTEREKRAINDLADREQVNYSQALNAALIATRDFAVGFCSRALTPEEKAFKAQGLNDPKVAALAAKLLDIMNNMCIYSRENWCSQYGSGQSPFVL